MLELLIKILIEKDGKEKKIELKEKDTEFFLFFKSHFITH